ncbi:MAG: hypothetical protein EBS68_08995, partial [Rhodobacteraceae bacterium]|nr:hypothetical protein [Paracoccaceae bacterium]
AATLPDLSASRLVRQLATQSNYVTLKRGLTPAEKRAVLNLGNPGLKLTATPRRVYPSGAAAAHLVGFASSDMNGLAGLERRIDGLLDAARDGELSENIFVPDENGQIAPRAALEALAHAGLTRVFCEGGGQLAASLMQAGLVDQLIVFSAGAIIGSEGLPGVGGLQLAALTDAPRWKLSDVAQIGADVMSTWERR